ncbi:MAG: bifunctional 5,10-methylenetetrahydrofolate dehydrogenase/5,10-methenyltetrahydrofolate cyclohydrolase [Clostridia bacterium]|nr:bifunctional 5,10-methylenetetrahydrofolate dehydrogenase/5,10-methenyltetrahydrofolate cyclohydrolase [Clostridia bacterium]
MANIIDGKKLSLKLRDESAKRVIDLKNAGIEPRLDVVIVGDDPASHQYVNSRLKDCEDIGLLSITHVLDAGIEQRELTELLDKLSSDSEVHGILLQMPLPKHMDQDEVLSHICPEKDVDGLTVLNAGALFSGREGFAPCTPSSIMHLIKSTGVPIKGKNAVVVGRSIVVGKPAAMLLLAEHATVTVCHSRTVDLKAHLQNADIVVAAVGSANIIKGDMLKPGAIVIDAGINRVDGKTVGDVEFDSAERIAGYISPVPGGVGPVTRKILLSNTLTAAERANGRR